MQYCLVHWCDYPDTPGLYCPAELAPHDLPCQPLLLIVRTVWSGCGWWPPDSSPLLNMDFLRGYRVEMSYGSFALNTRILVLPYVQWNHRPDDREHTVSRSIFTRPWGYLWFLRHQRINGEFDCSVKSVMNTRNIRGPNSEPLGIVRKDRAAFTQA